jgi:EmrB/QacA subfamily drug resistance transporter
VAIGSDPVATPLRGSVVATLVALAAGQALVSLDASVLNIAMPEVRSTLDASPAQMQAIIVSYLIAAAAFTLPLAALGNRIGRARVFLIGCALFVVGSLICATAPTADVLIAARAIQGLGAAGMSALALAILVESAPRERIPGLIGLWTSVAVGAAAAGPLIGGLLVSAAGWRSVFWINVPIALGVLLAGRILLPRNDAVPGAPRVDWLAAALLAVALGLFAGGVALSQSLSWSSPLVLGAIVVAVVAAGALVAQQRRSMRPLVQWRVLGTVPLPAALLMFVLLGLVLSGAMYVESLFSQDVLDATPAVAGTLMLGASIAIAVLSPITGRLGRRTSPARLTGAGLAVAALAVGGLSRLGPGDPVAAVALGLTVLGVGLALAMPTVQSIAMSAGGPAAGAEVSAGLNLASLVSSVLGISVLATLTTTVAEGSWTASGGAAAYLDDVGAGDVADVAASAGAAAGDQAASAFATGVTTSLLVAAVGLFVAAVVAVVTLPRHPLAEAAESPAEVAA